MARRHHPSLVALVAVVGLALGATALPAGADPPPRHTAPVDAPVVDPFRPPEVAWGAGNRGLEYGTEPGTEVRATADGVVVFAGAVAGSRHVTVRHADDVRTTYAFLADVAVVVGQQVSQGDVVGTTVGHLHLGARRGDAYFDPASLFADGPVEVRLVPFEIPPGLGLGGERSAISQLVGDVGGALGGAATWLAGESLDLAADGLGSVSEWLRDNGQPLLRTLLHYSVPVPLRAIGSVLRAAQQAHRAAQRPCTPADAPVAPPPVRRIAVRVAGLGSTSSRAAIDDLDLTGLGYRTQDVARFSYGGGATPGAGASFDGIATTVYDAADTQVDLWSTGRRLADLVEQAVARAAGAPVDLYAHSQGGLVLRVALIELERRHGAAWVETLGLVITMGTPHDGADLATLVEAWNRTTAGAAALDLGERVTGLDPDAPSARQLSETSELIAELEDHPLPEGLDVRSLAARGDVVVPVPRTEVDGATQVVVPVDGLRAHDALPGSDAARREVALALAALPPTCQGFGTQLRGQLTGELISTGEDLIGAVGWGYLATRGLRAG